MLTRSMIPEDWTETRNGVEYYVHSWRMGTRAEIREIDGEKWEVRVPTGELTVTFKRLDSLPAG